MRLLANWEVDSDIILTKGTPFVRYDHPDGKYIVFLRPSHIEGVERSKLALQIIFDAPDFNDARDTSEDLAKEFLDYLTFTTNIRARVGNLLHIFNWDTSEQKVRRARYFHTSPAEDAPYELLEASLLDTLKILQSKPISSGLRRALKWFANGVSSRYQDDKFAFFWFVVEIIGQIIKNTTPVPDKCPHCHGPLHCPACNATHLHRPYPKQAIEQVFQRYVKPGGDEFFKKAIRARNMLLHGDELHTIEAELEIQFHKLVDGMGHLAWTAIFDQFVPVMRGTKPSFLRTNKYVGANIHFSADVELGYTPNFDNPDPATFPKLDISVEYRDIPPQGVPAKPLDTSAPRPDR